MATEDTNGGRVEGVVGRRAKPYANGSYQNWRWDNAVRRLKRDGWVRMFKLTKTTRARFPRDSEYQHLEGTIFCKYYKDGYDKLHRVLFLLNEETLDKLPGKLGIDWLKRLDG